ncbi:MAG TPA: bifunctional pyr operon transcriptional regulator/uracil phosphoribosyltransferase PyrR [Solirubrobacteraceae bacterium]|nr:bifunctional pyr operon transcriptional regulator/uracil phosphoribosyltransferase PyrR [Solirubrobacteraceae bacterium]
MPEVPETVVLEEGDIARALTRIAHEIAERNAQPAGQPPFASAGEQAPGGTAIVGIHRRGVHLAQRLQPQLSELVAGDVPLGSLDIAFYRDDLGLRAEAPVVGGTQLDFAIDGATVVIVDDVLFTGRTVRAAIDALLEYGRPARVQLAVLIDRGHRELPIRPDYVGKNLPTARGERVNVRVAELDGIDEVTISQARVLA